MSGKVQVESRINKETGEIKLEIIAHADGASCADGVDDDLLADLMSMQIPGFGMPDLGADGETMEWRREKARKAVENKSRDMQKDDRDSTGIEENEGDGRRTRFYDGENTGKTLDKGFGV